MKLRHVSACRVHRELVLFSTSQNRLASRRLLNYVTVPRTAEPRRWRYKLFQTETFPRFLPAVYAYSGSVSGGTVACGHNRKLIFWWSMEGSRIPCWPWTYILCIGKSLVLTKSSKNMSRFYGWLVRTDCGHRSVEQRSDSGGSQTRVKKKILSHLPWSSLPAPPRPLTPSSPPPPPPSHHPLCVFSPCPP